ncbi:hypothetical protein [Pseudomonas aeruginosa]|uniref:hypothetical protein n=1 Tax=Pseudomonas aeruginosa TaxID=287 RepID=UPI001CBB63FC|nr:hypothetical protein [Pseudomonas aeruginosa]
MELSKQFVATLMGVPVPVKEALFELGKWKQEGFPGGHKVFKKTYRLCDNLVGFLEYRSLDQSLLAPWWSYTSALFLAAGYPGGSYPFENGEYLDWADELYDNPKRLKFIDMCWEVLNGNG